MRRPKNPDLRWYTTTSQTKELQPRCPFASVYRCPRVYASLSVLGRAGIATCIEPDEDARLLKLWRDSDLWPVTAEQETSAHGTPGKPELFWNFCPEVAF